MRINIPLFLTTDILTMHDPKYHITFGENIGDIKMAGVRASVDDPVHVKVQMIKLG
jgi:hypothetical protein